METRPGFDAATENPEQPKVDETLADRKNTKPGGPKKFLDTKGRRMAAAAAVVVGLGGQEGVRRLETLRDDRADRARWAQLREESPDIEPPPGKKLSEIPADQRDRVLAVRDKVFYLALDEARRDYRRTAHGPTEIAAVDALIENNLRHHSVARADSVLEARGMPVMIDRPYPFIRFVEAGVHAETKLEQSMRAKKTQGRFTTPYVRLTPDTIYMNVDNPRVDPRHILTHEEAHWRLSSFPNYQGVKSTFRLDEDKLHFLNEGYTERITREVLRAEGYASRNPPYQRNVDAADWVEHHVGRETFWATMEQSGLVGVFEMIKKKYGQKHIHELLSDSEK